MNILGNSIKIIRKSKKMTQKQLAELTGLKQNTISNHENGKRQLDETDIRRYAKALNVEPQQLFDNAASISAARFSTTLQAIQSVSERLEEPRRLNVLTYSQNQLDEQERAKKEVSDIIQLFSYNYYDHPASAGTGQYLTEVAVEQIDLPVDIDADFVIPIYGDSMEPDYHNGDYIFVKLSVDLDSGDIGVFDYEGDAYVKQLIIEDGQAYLHSLNPEYSDKPITANTNFRIIGEVVGSYTAK